MRFRVEEASGGTALIVEHDDGGRSFVAELDGLVAVGTYSAHQVRQMRYSTANRAGARKRVKRAPARREGYDDAE